MVQDETKNVSLLQMVPRHRSVRLHHLQMSHCVEGNFD